MESIEQQANSYKPQFINLHLYCTLDRDRVLIKGRVYFDEELRS